DTDSLQVRDPQHNVTYRCPVGTAEYTPPELQGTDFASVDRRPEHDLFGLAVLIFQLLMEGTHPFAGTFQGRGEPPPLAECIAKGWFPYGSQSVPFAPPDTAPPFAVLHPTLQNLFVRCFADGHTNPQARPDVLAWRSTLDEARAALITCSVNTQHRYGNHLRACPWCDRAAHLGGRDPFPSRQAVQRREHLQPVRPAHTPPRAPTPSRVQTQPTQPGPLPDLAWLGHVVL